MSQGGRAKRTGVVGAYGACAAGRRSSWFRRLRTIRSAPDRQQSRLRRATCRKLNLDDTPTLDRYYASTSA
eukprot:scaffold59662_cov20-Phaeocystis_antarctica.AAC.1